MADPLAPAARPRPDEPGAEKRRARDFLAEWVARTRAWLPDWNPDQAPGDPARAVFDASARLLAQVAERLDRVSSKERRNLYSWLGVRGAGPRGARLPVVFKLADPTSVADAAGVLAPAPVQLQADADGASLVFETETDVQLVRAKVAVVAGIDPAADAYYLPGSGFSDLEPAPLLPSRWEVVSLAAAGSTTLQLDPPLGLFAGEILEIGGSQYRIETVNDDIVGIDPPVEAAEGIAAGTVVTRVDVFAPFDGQARNRQAHALYIGHDELFDIQSTARIELIGAQALVSGFDWSYWGKVDGSDASAWQPLDVAPATADALVLDKSRKGAIEATVVGGVSSHWLRAHSGPLAAGSQPLTFTQLKIMVQSATTPSRPALEGLANTTPLVLDAPFLPLGREPRQFDAFYLGCNEVFSKHGASVTLDFRIADSSFATLSTMRTGSAAFRLVAGVGQDQSLHLLQFNPLTGSLVAAPGQTALQPPGTGASGLTALIEKPLWRLPMWDSVLPSPSGKVRIAVSSGRTVWIYSDDTSSSLLSSILSLFASDWIQPPGPPVAAQGTAKDLDALVHVPSSSDEGTLLALYDGNLYRRPALASVAWTQATLAPATTLKMLAAVEEGAGGAPSAQPYLVGIDGAGQLQQIADTDAVTAAAGVPTLSSTVQPTAVRPTVGGGVIVVAAADALDKVIAVQIQGTSVKPASLSLASGERVQGVAFDDSATGSRVVATVASDTGSRLVWWEPDFAAAAQSVLMDAVLSPATGLLAGTPLRMPQHVIVPGAQASVFELTLSATGASGMAPIEFWARLQGASTPFVAGDRVTLAAREGLPDGLSTIVGTDIVVDGAHWQMLSRPVAVIDPLPNNMSGFQGAGLTASVTADVSRTVITFADENALKDASHILIDIAGVPRLFAVVTNSTTGTGPYFAKVTQALPASLGTTPTSFTYWPAIDLQGSEVKTVIRFEAGSGGPDADAGDTLLLDFSATSANTPTQRTAHVMTRRLDGRPAAAWLDSNWTVMANPAFGQFLYSILAATGAWSRPIGVDDSNPELTWEYSNGRSWWQLPRPPLEDHTNNLKTSGKVTFVVPDDIAASDWSGRTNFWVRARLVGGDYGREVFTVVAKTTGDTTTQSVTRSTEGVRPPLVVSLGVTYQMNDARYPEHVMAEDAGTVRNQSDANRTPGAELQAFVPLAAQFASLATPTAGSAVATADACECGGGAANPCIPGTSEVAATTAAAAAGGGGPALLVGIDGVAEGVPVHLLTAVGEERDFDAAAPLVVDALVGGRFEPVPVDDGTRAIGESGIVSMSIAHAPSVTELFGSSLSWLRLSPAAGASWRPSVAGVWLNAAWVDAAQTQTYEVLGSSQGEPGLVLALARPPLVRGSLELRVAEPLGDEEVQALRVGDASMVLVDVDGLPGQWVRWTAVGDPADEAADARVYAVDEVSGEVRFGDGRAGMIPPIGRDNIVAFKYRRTEPLKPPAPDAPPPQVAIVARSALGLVTPLVGVESVVAALDSDAGAPADDAARLLRFAPATLRHRGRAVTASDIEALALQAMPAIAQVRCLGGVGALRLVVAMRGTNLEPARAVQRELSRLLLAAMPPSYSQPGSGMTLQIVPPVSRRLRVQARLRVATLDVAGGVRAAATAALRRYFDPAGGADDGAGWPFGASPDARSIAAVLVDTPDLDGIDALALLEMTPQGLAPWPATLVDDELAVLNDDGFDFSYDLIGAPA